MADDSDQEKTEEPTSKRLEDAQKQGQVARSRELNTFAMLLASTLMFLLWGKTMGLALIKLMQREFQLSRETIFDVASVLAHFKQVMFDGFMIIAPLLAVLVVTAILAPLALGGWVFSWEAIAPKFDKMDPFKGLARLFAVHGLIELGKALLKFLLIASVSWVLYSRYIAELSGLNAEPLEPALTHGLMIIVDCLLILTASLIVVVAVDVPFQLWEHSKKLKMSLQEIKEEMKESEGSPEVKSRIRRMQMEISRRRMMAEVPKADVIVTNPSHFAVALKYDPNSAGAPVLVAKGVDLIAGEIRRIAIESAVPLLPAPPLARALYYSTELNKEIPKGLYLAVAQVLAYVYQLKAARTEHWAEPIPPSDFDIPDEFKQSG